jgi:O-succinylbenzoic acid--CoA ligase
VVLIVEGDEIDIPIEFLDKYEKPKIIYFISEFIETESGKINRAGTILIINSKTA